MQDKKIADKIISILVNAGYTPDETLVVIEMARKKFMEMKESGQGPKERAESTFKQCLNAFQTAYKDRTGLDYSFAAKDGVAMASITKRIRKLVDADEMIVPTFTALIYKLPEWYVKNAFSLPVINGKFNEIVAAIKQNKNKLNDEYKERIARDLTGQ